MPDQTTEVNLCFIRRDSEDNTTEDVRHTFYSCDNLDDVLDKLEKFLVAMGHDIGKNKLQLVAPYNDWIVTGDDQPSYYVQDNMGSISINIDDHPVVTTRES